MASVLLCATPVHGHVTPVLAVATFLVDHGHRVRFLTGSRYQDKVEATGAEYLPLPAEADYDGSNLDAAFPGRVGLSGPAGIKFDLSTIFLKPAPAQLSAVDAAIAAETTDVVLVEGLFLGAAMLIARPRETRPPVVVLGIVPLSLESVDTAPYGLGVMPKPGVIGRVRDTLLAVLAKKVIFGSLQKEAERTVLAASGHPLRTFFLNYPALADGIVQFTVPSFEYPRSDLPDIVHFVGPVSRSTTSTQALPDWWGELDGSRPVVHVTQGTVANMDYDELIAPAMAGLADENVLVVVSTGGRDVATLPHPLPANVRASEYLPYDKLLPLTDVLLTNGGYGGVHYAMEYGVPLVVAGLSEDKTEVTARVQWSGAGINLKTNHPKPPQVRDAVRRVLADPSYGKVSARIGADIVASPGLAGLEDVVMTLTGAGAVGSI